MLKTVTFYQTSAILREKALCQLIAKIYNTGLHVVIRFAEQALLDELNKTLWSYSQKEFIPHGSNNDELPERQPVYLTTGLEVPNKATIAMHIGVVDASVDIFERGIYIFDNDNNNELLFAREKYKYFKGRNITTEYWQQTTQGSWEKIQ